ncbi:restriction endonuclease subunit S [Lacticaseibacillus paracasei]|uniref:restriction endonuclease subunit S n=1 Tax=Lacticaseibacillus paracasei TaxID=1597 RepID=UPI00345D9382
MSKDAKNVPALRFKGYSDAWEKRKLGELANIRRGASPRPIKNKKWFSQTSQVGWIRISDVTEQNGRIHQVEQHLSDAGQKKTLVLKSKHLLLSIAATVGKPVQNYIQVGVHDGFIVFMDPKFDLDFMFYFLEKYRPNWARFGQPGSQININSELVRDLVVSIPTVHEQVAVAQFIITLDNLIAATQHKIDALEQAKKALLQRLFDQSWRFKGYSDPWEKRKLGDVVERVTRKNRDLVSTRPLTISAQDVLVDQRNFFSKTVASKNISNYFLLKAGDFAYNKSYSVGYPWGAVKRLDKYPSGVLSTLYIVFKPKKINSQFLVTYFEGTTWYVSVSKVASEGARNHGLLNISASDFFDQQLFFPTKKTEQESIGLTIKVLDDLIAATQSRLSSLELLKKALLQDLFI